MLMEVTCRCGWSTRGSKAEVITRVQEHGRTAHRQDITAAQVREIWRAVEVDGAKK